MEILCEVGRRGREWGETGVPRSSGGAICRGAEIWNGGPGQKLGLQIAFVVPRQGECSSQIGLLAYVPSSIALGTLHARFGSELRLAGDPTQSGSHGPP